MEIGRLLDKFRGRNVQMMDQEAYRRYGILIPLISIESDTHLLFEVRSMHLRSQPGDTCFPGGRMDPEDAGLRECAIRETSEELGIRENDIDHVIELDYIISGQRFISPFAGRLKSTASIDLNEAEVAEVFTVPLAFFMNHEPRVHKVHMSVEPERDFPFELIQNGQSYDWQKREAQELFYMYKGRVIWGLTAKVIHHFVQLLKKDAKDE